MYIALYKLWMMGVVGNIMAYVRAKNFRPYVRPTNCPKQLYPRIAQYIVGNPAKWDGDPFYVI